MQQSRREIKCLCWVLALLAVACQQPRAPRQVERAIYYWKTNYAPTVYEKEQVNGLAIQQQYIRFFDVDWDELEQQVIPKAVVRFDQRPTAIIIPVVFITNESLQQLDSTKTDWLAVKIAALINGVLAKDSLPRPKEIQIDCDWSGSTKDKYFALLRQLQNALPGIAFSATIRLYQTKYWQKAGVPPVSRGLLMCYNMGNLKQPGAGNSIIDPGELAKYIANLNQYPLPLDVALPLFDWKVWFSKGSYKGIVQNLPDSLLHAVLFSRAGQRYTALYDTIIAGYQFAKGDWLRHETSNPKDVLKVGVEVGRLLKNTQCRVALYHLDSVLLGKYSRNELESFYNSLR